MLYGVDGAALAEFSNDHVTAWAAGAPGDSESGPAEQQWREWGLELAADKGTADTELLNRLSNRLLDAGAAPAGHGSKLARVLGETSQSNGTRNPRTHYTARWPSKSTSCWSGIAPCALTPPMPCTRCG